MSERQSGRARLTKLSTSHSMSANVWYSKVIANVGYKIIGEADVIGPVTADPSGSAPPPTPTPPDSAYSLALLFSHDRADQEHLLGRNVAQ